MTDQTKIPVPRRRWVTALLMAAVFINGVVVGGGAMSIYIMSKAHENVATPEKMPDRVGEFLAGRLSLTDDQRVKIRSILNERQAAIEKIHFNIQPDLENELWQSREEIGKVLTPEQRTEWEKIFDQTQARWAPSHFYQRRMYRRDRPGAQFHNEEQFMQNNNMRGPMGPNMRGPMGPNMRGPGAPLPMQWSPELEKKIPQNNGPQMGPGMNFGGRRFEPPRPPEPPREEPPPEQPAQPEAEKAE